jgi:very-short-patch-repair endonuclease
VKFNVPLWRGPDVQLKEKLKRGWIKITTNCNFQLMNFDNHKYNKNLQPYANRLRKEMTKAEACLWKYTLKAKQLRGYQFRRQRPVLNYIADFICLELMLIIEVDGLTHHWEESILKDKKKQTDLEAAGFTVLRFTDDEVLNNIKIVHDYLENWIESKLSKGIKSESTPT